MFHRHDVPSAGTRSGTTWRRQPKVTSGSIWPMTWREATALGLCALRIVSAAPDTVSGSSASPLFGICVAPTQPPPKTRGAVVAAVHHVDSRPEVPCVAGEL